MPTSSAFGKAIEDLRQPTAAFPNVSVRWLLSAAAVALLAALTLAWLTLCLLFWQGSWQLLYHPSPAITRTPAAIGLPFESVHFAATETGHTQLTGWYIPAEGRKYTTLYFHGADGNLSNTLKTLAALHKQNLAIFAIDYRGYGQSEPSRPGAHPNEKQLRQDAEWSLTWLTLTRQIPAKSILVAGTGLGANLAAELAADHPELAGVILDHPRQNALGPVFDDPRSSLVPAHSLVKDRYDLVAAAERLRIGSLWLLPSTRTGIPTEDWATPYGASGDRRPWITPVAPAYDFAPGQKTVVWMTTPSVSDAHFTQSLQRWMDDL